MSPPTAVVAPMGLLTSSPSPLDAMVIFAIYQFWVYPFLNWSTPSIAAYYVGFTVAVVIIHFIWYGLTLLRNKLSHYDPEPAQGGDVKMGDIEAGKAEEPAKA